MSVRYRSTASLVVAVCTAAIACGAALPAGASAASAPGQPATVALSNDLTLTTWAHPEATGGIYAKPEPGAARVAKVHLYDADGFPEVYLLLSGYVDGEGREWVRVRIPGR